MLKKIISILILLLIGDCGTVSAKDKVTTSSTINGVTVKWEYELNDLNQIENLKCTNPAELTGNIMIPSSLDEKTVVTLGNNAFKSAKGITEIRIPSSIIEIGYGAFENCTKLNKVDLGNIKTLSFQVFKGCTSLTEITIPKTLKNGSVSPCLDNPNIKKINLEEGLTIIPQNLCANTGITEITIPSSVTEIEHSAFNDCSKLKKITISSNVSKMGFYNISDSDSIFENHDEDLTVYCYKDSMAANYAIKYNIKYLYLTKPTGDVNNEENKNNGEDKPKEEMPNTTESTQKRQEDNTTAIGVLPKAGVSATVIISIIAIIIISIFIYKKYNNYKDIK